MRSLVAITLRTLRPRILPVLTSGIVLVSLIVARKTIDVPKPLIITLGLCFLGPLTVVLATSANKNFAMLQSLLYLLLPWSVISVVVLGAVYYFDRSGWLWYQVSGYNESIEEILVKEIVLSPSEFVRRNSSFVLDPIDKSRVILPRGEYLFSRTIVFPKSAQLIIEPGAILKMGPGCSLISYSQIIAHGTEEKPIIFSATNHWFKWGVVGLVGAVHSEFEHVHFENARQAMVNGTDFPGGLSLIDTNGEIKNCQFVNMFGKDAIYVRHSHISIHDNRVEQTFKDGIDLDNSSGEVCRNVLINCDDEGIDLSDDTVADVRQNVIRDRHGGRIATSHDLDRVRLANILEYSSHE